MHYETIRLKVPYEALGITHEGTFCPTLTTYFIGNSPEMEEDRRRPCVLICPGGGYAMTSDREAEPVALAFVARGFHAAVLRYSVAPAPYPSALLEVCTALKLLHEKAAEWKLDAGQISVAGFSAGGHLACSQGMFWVLPEFSAALGVAPEVLRPSGLILSYPVISSGEYAHKDSFKNLLGPRHAELLEWVSLENRVGAQTPPTFLWHTFADEAVPVENSLLLANALRRADRPFELHIFPNGVHGLSLATPETGSADGGCIQPECAIWIDLAADWLWRQGAL